MRNVGCIGLGIMGSAMSANLARAGFRVFGYDILRSRRRRLANAGGVALDTVSQVAERATISGDARASKSILPVLKGFSRKSFYLGRFGNGSKMKFAANLLVAIHNVSSAEAVILARKSGLPARMAVAVLGDGAGASRMLQVRGPMMARRRYRPATMSNELWQKDMRIISDFVRRLRSPAPLFRATQSIYRDTLSCGLGKADTAAVCAVLEKTKKR